MNYLDNYSQKRNITDYSKNFWKILACPFCGNLLENSERGALCNNCQSRYERTDSGVLDLRLQRPKKFEYVFELGSPLSPDPKCNFCVLPKNPNPEVNFLNFDNSLPHHLTNEIVSYFPKAKNNDSLMLDVGCGRAKHRQICEHAGFEYFGIDCDSANRPPILGDAHALPFKDESFDFVLALNVLEHIRFPFVMMREVYRVLKPNCKFLGTVAFLEPFHYDSLYHHSHLATYNSLKEGGFDIQHIAPSAKWTSLIAQANMVLFPKMPTLILWSIVMPIQIFHKIWWKIGNKFRDKATENNRITYSTGLFTFIAQRRVASQ